MEEAIDVVDDDFGTDLEQAEEEEGRRRKEDRRPCFGSPSGLVQVPTSQKTLSRQNIIRTCEREGQK